jgi:potassium-transporting ATPase KdpC subunit
MNTLLRQSLAGLRILLVLTVLLGILYPLAVWAVSRVPGLWANAEGSIVEVDGRAAGSDLIGIDPVARDPDHDQWFHTRPSATDHDPSTSGGSNKGGFDEELLATVQERRDVIAEREDVDPTRVPADAVTASASGLDPHISPAYADLQTPRVARENGLSEDQVRDLVAANTDGRGIGIVGEPGVNVLRLNLAVQEARRAGTR